MKNKLVAGAVALALISPIAVPVSPVALAQSTQTYAETLNPRVSALTVTLGGNGTSGTTLRADLADNWRLVESIELDSWESPFDVKVSTATDSSVLGKTERIWVEPIEEEKYPRKFEIDLKVRVVFTDGSSSLYPVKLPVRVAADWITPDAERFEPSLAKATRPNMGDDPAASPGYHWAYKIEGVPDGTRVSVQELQYTVGRVIGDHLIYWAPDIYLEKSDSLPVNVTFVYDDFSRETKRFLLPASEARLVETAPRPRPETTTTKPATPPTPTTKETPAPSTSTPTSAPTTAAKPPAANDESGSSTGQIIGIIVGVLAVLGIVAAAAVATGAVPGVNLPF